MQTKRTILPRLIPAFLFGLIPVTATVLLFSLPLRAALARHDFSAGTTPIPLGAGQPDDLSHRNAYKALWHALYEGLPPLAWTAVTVTADSTDHGPGAVIGNPHGDFLRVSAAGPFSVSRALALHPRRVAPFYPAVRNEYGQTVAWEEDNFEQLFRV